MNDAIYAEESKIVSISDFGTDKVKVGDTVKDQDISATVLKIIKREDIVYTCKAQTAFKFTNANRQVVNIKKGDTFEWDPDGVRVID